jgi:hypothetical protein
MCDEVAISVEFRGTFHVCSHPMFFDTKSSASAASTSTSAWPVRGASRVAEARAPPGGAWQASSVDEPTQRFEAAPLRQASLGLALEGLAARVNTALLDAGVRCILLKGPALAEWLYADEPRAYSDVDLLIRELDHAAAERALRDLGFVRVAIDVLPHDRPHHARTYLMPRGAAVDLHHTLVGIGAPSQTAWDVLAADTDWLQLGDGQIEVLSLPVRALAIVLHAAQHGAGAEGPLEDLRRVLEQFSLDEWKSVHELAKQLEAVPAFGAGLRLLPPGGAVASELALPETASVETLLRSTGAPTMSLGFDWLARTHGSRRRATFIARKIAPQPEFMRAWTPLARRGRPGLAAAYLWRVTSLALRAGPAYIAWRKARRAARSREEAGSEPGAGQRPSH